MNNAATIIRESRTLLKKLTDQVPKSLYSLERQMFIGNALLRQISDDQRLLLRRLVEIFLLKMREMNASDIDMGGWGARKHIWLRIQGKKKPVPNFGTYDPNEIDILVQNLLMDNQRQYLFEHRNIDFSYSIRVNGGHPIRYRADAYFDLDSLSLNMRAIQMKIRPYQSYGFHQNVTRMLSLEHTKEGLILITGITGSGKSTTLDAIVDLNNRTVDAHIIIISSPIQFIHESQRCIIRHREVGRDTLSFKQGTIEALRQDPDIIVIGEMRDPDTIMAALEVADSGHKVFSTLHTSSAVESIDRIIGEVPPIEQERVRNRLADVLRCVISQKLVPARDGKLILAKEIMIMTPSILAAIKNNNTSEIYQMISEGSKLGMITIEQDLRRLYLERKITLETAISFANNKRRIQQLLQAA